MSGTNTNDQMPRSVFEDLADVGQYCRGDALPNCDHVGDAIDNLCAGGAGGARGATEPAYDGSVVMEQSTRNADDRSSASGVNAAAVAAAGVGVGVAAGYAVTRRGQSMESTHAPAPVEEVPLTEPEQLARSASVQSRAEQSTSVQSTASAETSGATSFASRISAMSSAAAAAIGLDYPMELAPTPTIETEPPAEEEAAFVGGDLNKLTDPEDGGGLEDVEFKKDDARDDAATVDSSEGGMGMDAPLPRKKKKRFAALGPLGIAALVALLAGAGLAIGLSVGRGNDQASAMAVPEPDDPCEEVPSMMGSKSSKSEKEMSSRRTEEETTKEEALLARSGRWQRRALQRVVDKTVTEEGIEANGEKTGWIRRGRQLEGHLATATKSSKTSKASTDDGCSKSSKGTKSSKSSKSAGTPSAVPSLEPSASSAPSLEPSVSSAPSTSAMPSASSAPSLQPSLSPTASSQPSTSASPSTSAEPSVSTAPSLEPSLSPTASSPPSTSASPSASAEPSASSKPSVSAKPSTSASPSASAEPSASSAPSLQPSLSPSASAQPSTSASPSAGASAEPSLEPSVSSVPSYSARPSFPGGDKCQIFQEAMETPFSTCSGDKPICCNMGSKGNMNLDCRSGCAPCQKGASSNECCVDLDIPCGTGANAAKPICCKLKNGNAGVFECKAEGECDDGTNDLVEPVVEDEDSTEDKSEFEETTTTASEEESEGMACGDIFCPTGTSCVFIPALVPGMGEAHYDCLSN